MTMIAEKDRETIRHMLQTELADEVELLFFTRPRSPIFVPGRQDCQTCDETRELLEDLVALSDKLSLTAHNLSAEPDAAARYGVREVPTIILRRKPPTDSTAAGAAGPASPDGEPMPSTVRFVGLPAGYEFSTLLADLADLSNERTDLSEPTREAVRAIDEPVHIRVFVTPT